MAQVIEFLVYGILLGLTQGLSPGPLITLIFSETLKYGKKEGFKIAISPLITDSVIVFLSLLILSNLSKYTVVIGIISLFGAFYLIYLGIENLRIKKDKFTLEPVKKGALKRGIIANFLSPHPYLFWLSIGGPTILESARISITTTALFIVGIYTALIGSKLAVTLIVDKSKTVLKSKYYVYAIQALGIVLFIFAIFFIKEGLDLIGLL
jgi:threonine/homoserine/homoserine lactone efflux protein